MWNDSKDNVNFGKDKKKSISKDYKRIGYHMITVNTEEGLINEENSPILKKCEGCELNISKDRFKEKRKQECLIYLNNDESRILTERKEGEFLKPYKTWQNIKFKNNLIKQFLVEEEIDKVFNEKIDLIDRLIGGDKVIIEIIKNNIIEVEDE